MKKIRAELLGMHIPHCASISDWVTVSIGGATIVPGEGDFYDVLLKKADEMLYIAKEQGRNRVVWINEKNEQWEEKEGGVS